MLMLNFRSPLRVGDVLCSFFCFWLLIPFRFRAQSWSLNLFNELWWLLAFSCGGSESESLVKWRAAQPEATRANKSSKK